MIPVSALLIRICPRAVIEGRPGCMPPAHQQALITYNPSDYGIPLHHVTNCIIADPKRSANLDFSIILDISIKLILNTILPNIIGIIVSVVSLMKVP